MTEVVRPLASGPAFLAGGGEVGALMRAHDWSASPLGEPSSWPQSLRSVAGLLLASKFPMFVAWGPELGFLYNDAYAEILGAKHPAALGSRFQDIWAEIWSDITPMVDAALAGEASYHENLPLVINRQGFDEPAWFTFSYSPVRDESGLVSGMYCAVAETTATVLGERRQAIRLALEERLRDLTDPDAIMAEVVTYLGQQMGFDRVGFSEVVEDRTLRVTGSFAANGMAPLNRDVPIESFGPTAIARQRQGITEVIDDVVAGPEPGNDVWAALDLRSVVSVPMLRDGAWVAAMYVGKRVPRPWAPDDVALIEEAAARIWGAVERVRAAAALRESEARLRAVIDAAPVGLVFADASGRITGANARVEEILGQSVARSGDVERYRDDYVAFHADGRRIDGHEYPLAYVVRGEAERAELEAHVQLPDGSRRWVRYIATPVTDERGRIMGGVVASVDIDREKRLAENLAREVEAAVAEREAAQEQLRQSQKLEAMGQLTGGVAHDFNNLLTPIIASLDMLLRRGVGSERERRLMDGALQSAERAKVLVQRLLAFARRQPLQPGPVDVKQLVSGMAELIASTLGPRIDVRVELPADLPPALADANQLEMAVLNLAVNARDAMPEGGRLTIAAARESVRGLHRAGLRRGHYVRLSVQDTGTGMDEATRVRAVEPFFSTKGVGRGTGLGLSMVHGLAAQLGGGLAITSSPGWGTTVELWLPISGAAVGGNEQAPKVEPAHNALGLALLVDDEDLVRLSTADMLQDLGYEVMEASSAEEALRLLGEGLQPDLVVTDHLMPGLSGAELARAVRATNPDLPVLIVSGYADVEGIAPGLPRLTKPFRSAELAASLRTLMPAGPR